MKKIILLFIFFLFINTSSLLSITIKGKTRVVDGDTIHIKNNKIRLHGIDAPETQQTCNIDNEEWYCGKQSTKELKKLINKQNVECVINDVDVYNRYIAICYIDEININQWMVKNGWAIAYRYYSKDYINEEEYANNNKLGIWKSKFIEPYLFRKKNKN